jgi:hypothetical protein
MKLLNEEFHNVCFAPDISKVIKPMRVVLAGRVACIGVKESRLKLEARDYFLLNLSADGRTILRKKGK